jgi:hypothetical protein
MQIFDVHHRRENVHDSYDALQFIAESVAEIRSGLPAAALESRPASGEKLVAMLRFLL